MLTALNVRVTVEHREQLDEEAVRAAILAEFQQMARKGRLLAIAPRRGISVELFVHAIEPLFTPDQQATLLDAIETEAQGLRDSLRHFGDWKPEELAEMQQELAVLDGVRARVAE
jgi:hypothetical protein